MKRDETSPDGDGRCRMKKVFKYQSYHLAVFLVLGSILWFLSASLPDDERVFGIGVHSWIWISWSAVGVFHAWVVVFWRLELHFRKISEWFGASGFTLFRIGFVGFAGTGFLALLPIAFLTHNTVSIDPRLKFALIAITTAGALWTLYSVFVYFGPNRAFGADHFFEEYRNKPLERRGSFRYIPNSMYTLALLLLYHPGLFYESSFALLLALFHHLFVWTHYFCTEKPDLLAMHPELKKGDKPR